LKKKPVLGICLLSRVSRMYVCPTAVCERESARARESERERQRERARERERAAEIRAAAYTHMCVSVCVHE
jgi:hypothetical protein